MPEQSILRTKHPMVLLRKYYHLGRYTHHLCTVECRHSLVIRYTKILASVDYEQRFVPVLYELVCRMGVVAFCLRLFTPRGACLVETIDYICV